MGTPRVLIACNGSVTWAGIKVALEAAGMEVGAEVRDARELPAEVARHGPDVCLVDAQLDGGVEQVAALANGPSRTRVIVLASKENDETGDEFLAVMNAGAVGYLPLTISPKSLPTAVQAVLHGELAVPRALISMLVDHLRARSSRRHLIISPQQTVDLTAREWDVLELLRDGHSTAEIAARLAISDITVRRHIGGILRKMRVQTRGEALELLASA